MEYELIIFVLAWFLGAFISGLTSFGSAMVAMPIVAFYLPPKIILPVAILLVITTSFSRLISYRSHINYKALIPLTLAAIPGSIAGGYILLIISSSALQLFAGIVLIVYFILQIIPHKEVPHDDNRLIATIAGFISGFTNASISFSAPSLVMYAIYAGWTKEIFFSTMSVSIFLNSVIAAIVHASSGLYTAEMLKYLSFGIPTVLLGLACSRPIERRINVKTFRRIIIIAIGCSGLICITKALLTFYAS